ncbi:DUF1707 SHOCT-like domain-containing protein [Rhodococcus phenolicus]|uniref:DUF1707 SHOCT-like domain-containing protein n=1 Tax=Rhodococcus phenolicus TaxID=263849 RepID=UPI00082E5962|nr:DUF1707 domain-containing protein [Rhodococcus phenolicus]
MPGESDHDDLLLSDDERMHALNLLGDHYAAGRLDSAEFYDRSADVASARTLAAIREPFRGLPGGVPLAGTDGHVRKIASPDPAVQAGDLPATPTPEAELASLRSRGSLVESLDWVIIGITLAVFLVLQIVVDWDHAWIVWPSLIVTLSVPRMILRYSDDDEEAYEELKEADAKARRKRLDEAAERIRQLEQGDGKG